MIVLDVLGWTGTLLYLLNHGYISLNSQWNKTLYYAGNCIAALLLVISSLALFSWQAVSINAFWATISAAYLLGITIKQPLITRRYFEIILALFIFVALLSHFLWPDWTFGILGWSSVFAFCIGYLLFFSGHLQPRYYFLYSAYAATVILPQLWVDDNLAVFVLECIWALLSLYAAIKRFSKPHIID